MVFQLSQLGGHELGQVEQLLVLVARPLALGLLDGGVQPLEPARLALLGRLAVQQRADSRPLVFAVLHDGFLEDLVLDVAPDAALDHAVRHLGGCGVSLHLKIGEMKWDIFHRRKTSLKCQLMFMFIFTGQN